jgi:peptidyl-prolyl cis-trans isomerase B (cyclophilin B)
MQKPSMKIQNFVLVGFCLITVVLGSCSTTTSTQGSASTSASSKTAAPVTATYDTARAAESPSASTSSSSNSKQFPDLPRLSGKTIVTMVVKGKPVVMEIDGDNAPITGGNFMELVEKGFYNGLTFHRVVKAFVAQGGDPKGTGLGGYVPKGSKEERRIPLEIKLKGAAAPSYSNIFEDVQSGGQAPELVHKRGVLAMARSNAPDSASSQFYITLADVNFLDGKYAVFGKVTKGMEVVDTIKVGDKITSIKVTGKSTESKQPTKK